MGYPVVSVLTKDGIGFGKGSISVKKQLKEGSLTKEALNIAIDLLKRDNLVYTAISPVVNDDGCGDGRPTGKTERWIDGEEEVLRHSLPRAKVFGGGLLVAGSMYRILSGIPSANDTIFGDRTITCELLEKYHVFFGGHTDNHASGNACGCGAMDNYSVITQSIVEYRKQIDDVLHAIYADNYNESAEAINQVFDDYKTIIHDTQYLADPASRKTMDYMREHGAVIKRLDDGHLEDMVLFNYIEGTTLDQRVFNDELQAHSVDTEVQCFVVDVWRGEMYARVLSRAFERRGIDKRWAYKLAMADFYIRTIATAATLTAGDQPILVRK